MMPTNGRSIGNAISRRRSWHRRTQPERIEFATDSPLEGGGCEPSVPRRRPSPPWPLNLLHPVPRSSGELRSYRQLRKRRVRARQREKIRTGPCHTKSALRRSTRTSRSRFKEGPETCREEMGSAGGRLSQRRL